MNKELKQKWVDALRSGNYTQGTGRLRTEQAYCCLGVLCDLAPEIKWDRGLAIYEGDMLNSSGYSLPRNFAEFCELSEKMLVELIEANDDKKLSFEQIASLIETRIS